MQENEWLAQRFEESRTHLRAMAYRMLGSLSEADDAVQEGWLRVSRSDTSGVENLRGWLTTVVARVCLDMLRSRKARREEPQETPAMSSGAIDPEQEAMLAESVGLALLVVLEKLAPAERLAFVLHDLFAVPFEEIASIVGRSPEAARQLASRARRRVQGGSAVADLAGQRKIVDAFLAAIRARDLDGLLSVLDPDLVVHADAAAGGREVHGAENWAKQAIIFSRGMRSIQPALVDGAAGIIAAPRGRLFRVLRFTIVRDKITEIEVIADANRLERLNLGVLGDV